MGGKALKVAMAGVDHKTPIDIREKFAFTDGEARAALRALKARGVHAALLSTCNRTELWLEQKSEQVCDPAALLCALKGISGRHAGALYRCADEAAANHLFRVAAGLESRVRGEDQILGQVKAAAEMAIDERSSGAVLNTLMRVAVTAAKQVKTDLRLSAIPPNAPAIAAELAKNALGSLYGQRVLIIGDGLMGRLTAETFHSEGAKVLLTRRRHKTDGVEVACAQRVPYDDRYEFIAHCAVVISATASPHFTLEGALISAALNGSPLVMVDLAVPRDIDPAAATISGVTLYDVDAIGGGEMPGEDEAMAIWAQQSAKFYEWHASRTEYRRSNG